MKIKFIIISISTNLLSSVPSMISMERITCQSTKATASALLAGVLINGALPADAQAKKTMVCNAFMPRESVHFGRAYQQSDGRWTTEGTWDIPAGKCLGLYSASSKPFTIYYAVLNKDLTPFQYGGPGRPMLCLGIPRRSDELFKISNQAGTAYTGTPDSIRPCSTNGVSRGILIPFIRKVVNPGEDVTLTIPGGWNVR